MKKIMAAALGLGLLSGTAVFAQDTAQSNTDTNTMKSSKKKHKKHKKDADKTATTSTTK